MVTSAPETQLEIHYSKKNETQGGDIQLGLDTISEIELFVNSEDAFFNKVIFLGLYIKNPSESNTVIRNLEVDINGGSTTRSLVDNFEGVLRNQAVTIDPNDVYSLVNTEYPAVDAEGNPVKDAFGEYFWTRFQQNQQPFLPTYGDIYNASDLESTSDEDPFYIPFKEWLFRNIVFPASTRSSLFGQVTGTTLVLPKSILNTVDDSGTGIGFDLSTAAFSEYSTFPNLAPGSYWGFWVKLNINFDPSAEFDSDFCFMTFTWEELHNGVVTTKQSPQIRIKIIANYSLLLDMFKGVVDNMYSKYPNYFLNYQDIET